MRPAVTSGPVTLTVAAPLSLPRYTVGFMEQAGELVGRALVVVVDDRVINSADALVAAVRSKAPGDKVTLTYLDPAGKPQSVEVTLGKAEQ